MLIRRITLNDYGAYAGRHTFDVSTTPSKPIILIGGLNGGGKTTLFESVLVCLYGRLHTGTGRKEYERRLAKMAHRSPKSGLAGAESRTSVEVEFRIYHNGDITEYLVERSWGPDGSGEELRVKKTVAGERNPSDLDLVERDQWQAFINGLVPRRIADLFFFDGEQVARMADHDQESAAIRASFSSLLGLDIVERLQEDLRTHTMRNLSGDDRHLQEEYQRLEEEKARAEDSAGRLRESKARKETELARVRDSIEEAEARLELLGGSFAQKRQDVKARLAAGEARLEMAGKRMAQICAADLPFAIIPGQMDAVRDQMDEDRAISRRAAEWEAVSGTLDRIGARIAADKFPEWTDQDIREDVKSRMVDLIEQERPAPPDDAAAETFGFSTPQRDMIRRVIDAAGASALEAARDAAAEYAQSREDVSRLKEALASAPADDEIGPVVSDIGRRHAEEGRLEAEAEHLDRQEAAQEALVRNLAAKMRAAVDGQYKSGKGRRTIELTKGVQKALEVYSEMLRAEKKGLLEAYIMEAADTLMHKRNFIRSVSVDPQTFRVSLYGQDDNPIPHDSLSRGEHQMLATSILWALARTSGRPLPFMIDTPLARLDSEHRVNLIERFFPLASHQTLVFSTDSEIDSEYYAKLRPYVQRSYSVTYDPDSGGTVSRRGYFWDGEGREVR